MERDSFRGMLPREKSGSEQPAVFLEEKMAQEGMRLSELSVIHKNSDEELDSESAYEVQECRPRKHSMRRSPISTKVPKKHQKTPEINCQTKEQGIDEVPQDVMNDPASAKAEEMATKDLAAAKAEETKPSSMSITEDIGSKAASPNRYHEMAKRLCEEYHFIKLDGQLYLYSEQEGFWKIIKESEANREIRNIIPDDMRGRVNKTSLYEVYEWIRIFADEVTDDAQKRRRYINFADWAYDWKNGNPKEKRKKLMFRYAIQLSLDDLASKSNGAYAKFIKDVFGDDQETIREFRKFVGLCLSDIRNLKFCFFLYGPSNSGKTVMLNLLKRIVGEEWCSSLSFAQMSNEFAITQLLGKRLNLSGEVSGASNKRLDIFKSLTGNDTITASFKGKDHFQFKNESLLVFACNSFPMVSSLEEFDSFLSRIIIFPFFNVKPREEWIDNLEDLLLDDAYAIVEDAIKGLKDLECDGFSFKESRLMKECKQDFLSQYNSFALFADEFIIQNPDGKITSDQIRGRYYTFCKERGYMVLPDNVWSQYLKQKFVCEAKMLEVLENGEKRRKRGYQGIELIQRESPH